MSVQGWVVAIAAAAAAFLAFRPAGREPADPQPDLSRVRPAGMARLRGPGAALCALGAWTLLGGWPGLLAAVGAAVFAWRVLGGVEDPASRRRREELERDLPGGVDLVAGCLLAGAAVATALDVVADAWGGALGEELRVVVRRLELGTDPGSVWAELSTHPHLGALGRCLARSHDSGASVAAAVGDLAEDLRSERRADVDALARTVEVRAAAPLGLCFLPAFVLIGVVPLVAGTFATMTMFG